MIKSWITRKYLFVESLDANIPDYIGYFKVVVGVAKSYVFVEKPVALELSHVREMLEDEKVIVGMVERVNAAILTLKENINKATKLTFIPIISNKFSI